MIYLPHHTPHGFVRVGFFILYNTDMKPRTGTPYYISLAAAVAHYPDVSGGSDADTIDAINEGRIFYRGKPTLQPGEELSVENGRYFVVAAGSKPELLLSDIALLAVEDHRVSSEDARFKRFSAVIIPAAVAALNKAALPVDASAVRYVRVKLLPNANVVSFHNDRDPEGTHYDF